MPRPRREQRPDAFSRADMEAKLRDKIDELEQQKSDVQLDLAVAQDMIVTRDAQIVVLRDRVDAKDAIIAFLQQTIISRDQTIADRDALIQRYVDHIAANIDCPPLPDLLPPL